LIGMQGGPFHTVPASSLSPCEISQRVLSRGHAAEENSCTILRSLVKASGSAAALVEAHKGLVAYIFRACGNPVVCEGSCWALCKHEEWG